MKNITFIVLAACVACIFCGCNKDTGSGSSSSGSGGAPIAVVNPALITDQAGWSAEARKNLQDAETAARKQIEAHLAPARTAFEQKKTEIFGAAKLTPDQINTITTRRITKTDMLKMGLTDQQIDDLQTAGQVFQAEISNAQSALQQTMQRQTQNIQNALSEALNPLIRQVAKDKGRTVVLYAAQVNWYDPSLDITDDVVKEIQKRPSMKVVLPEMPNLQWQPASGPTSMPAGATTMPIGPAIIAPSTTQPAPVTKP